MKQTGSFLQDGKKKKRKEKKKKKPVGRSGPTTKGGEGSHFKHLLSLGIETHDALPSHTQKDLDHLVLLGDFFLLFINGW